MIPGSDPSSDPGWRAAVGGLGRLFVPGATGADPSMGAPEALSLMRLLFLAIAAMQVLVAIVVSALVAAGDPGGSGLPPGAASAAVAVAGIADLATTRLAGPKLDCSDEARLVASYRTRFFVRLAMSEVPSLLGFVAALMSGSVWPLMIGVVLTALGFASVAPTAANLERDQQQLITEGCALALVPALRRAPRR